MDGDGGDGAVRLGGRVLGGVEVGGLGEVLRDFRKRLELDGGEGVFGVSELDALLEVRDRTTAQAQVQVQPRERATNAEHDTETWIPTPGLEATHAQNDAPARPTPKPRKEDTLVVELVSPHPAHHPSPAGKSTLLHTLTTHAVLPSQLSSVPLQGLTATILILDPRHNFSVSRLATTALAHIASCFTAAGHDPASPTARKEIIACVAEALRHVHIFRPVGWDALIATLAGMEGYLFAFEAGRHASSGRRVHALILEDIDAYTPSLRAGADGAGVAAASARFSRCVVGLARTLDCAVVTTGRSSTAAGLRPGMPLSWAGASAGHTRVVRLGVGRVEVVPFAPGMSVGEAEGERGMRGGVVRRGRVEVWRVGGGEREGVVVRIGEGVGVEVGDGE